MGRCGLDRRRTVRVADCDHDRAIQRRSLVAAFRLPATLPARSEVISLTDRLPRRGTASSLSRIRAATLRPVARASCLNRRRVVSGSLTVMPFMIAYQRNSTLTEWQYRSVAPGGAGLSPEIRTPQTSCKAEAR